MIRFRSGILSSAFFCDFSRMLQLCKNIAGIHLRHGRFVHSESDKTLLLFALTASLWPCWLSWSRSVLISFCCSAHDPRNCLNYRVKFPQAANRLGVGGSEEIGGLSRRVNWISPRAHRTERENWAQLGEKLLGSIATRPESHPIKS